MDVGAEYGVARSADLPDRSLRELNANSTVFPPSMPAPASGTARSEVCRGRRPWSKRRASRASRRHSRIPFRSRWQRPPDDASPPLHAGKDGRPLEAFLGGDFSHSVEGELVARSLSFVTRPAFLPVTAKFTTPVGRAPCQLPHAGVAVLHVLDDFTVIGEVSLSLVGQANVVAVVSRARAPRGPRVRIPFFCTAPLGWWTAHGTCQAGSKRTARCSPAVGGFRGGYKETVQVEPLHHP